MIVASNATIQLCGSALFANRKPTSLSSATYSAALAPRNAVYARPRLMMTSTSRKR